MIRKNLTTVIINKPPTCTLDDWNTLKHVAAAYGFLLKNGDNFTLGEFAKVIKLRYDFSLTQSHNRAAYDVLVKYSDN